MSHRTAPQVTTLNRVEYLMQAGRPPASARVYGSRVPQSTEAAPKSALIAASVVFFCGLMVGMVAI